MKTLAMFGLGLVVIAFIVALTCIGSYNKLNRLSQATDSQWAQVQNVYQRRAT